ncbi:hypothetical protein MRX96_049448 [Rhipicephalus microplus]
MSRRGSKSRSAPRSRPSSPSPARSGSRGRSTSRTRSGSSNRPRSNTPSGGKGKSNLTWADRARGNQAQASSSQDSHDPRLTNELKEIRRANDSLRKENALFKQEISRLATEIAEIRKLALIPPAPPAATSSSVMDTAEAPPKAGAVKRRALDSSREDETLELLSELKKAISNIQSGLSQVFTRAGVSGIMHDFIIYECKGTARDNRFGISADIVIDLVKDFPENRNHKLFFDNWFSSLPLVDELKRKGFLSAGTVRVDRTEKCPLAPDATLKAQRRGSVNFRVDEDSNIGVIKWFDSNSVHLVSSYAGVQPTDLCKWWNSKEKRSIDVPRPFTVKEYNACMGGVDLVDMLI